MHGHEMQDKSKGFLFQLILGGSDEEYFYGPMDYFPVDNDGRWSWMVQIKSVVTDDYIISTNSKALIDTGTAYIKGPRYAADMLNRHIGIYLDCSDLTNSDHPNVTFSFGEADNTFVLTAEDYIHRENEAWRNGSCFSKFSSHDEDHWILGDTFM